jgi:hypothetical protein
LSILDSIPAAIGAAFATVFRDAVLAHISGRVADGRGGFTNATTTDACKALVTDYTSYQRGTLGIPTNERKILMLASTLTTPPAPGDAITIQGRAWSVIEVASDPANATYECRAK